MEPLTTHSKSIRLFFFWIGIIATFAYRVIVVLNYYSPIWVQIAWYVGTIGFVAYFIHRFQVSEKRAKVIAEHDLANKVDTLPIADADRQAMQYIFSTLRSSKERWNYIFIFVLSGMALLVGIVMDFILPYTK
ncbi:MAG: hypothetical protein HZC01_02925 [Candidatus Kerfeldbacteria bacterium]|nr:hypothetical protein [Candidatus Kerfeldbacteria bacterium]